MENTKSNNEHGFAWSVTQGMLKTQPEGRATVFSQPEGCATLMNSLNENTLKKVDVFSAISSRSM